LTNRYGGYINYFVGGSRGASPTTESLLKKEV